MVCRKRFADETLLDPNFVYIPVNLGADNPQCFIPEVKRSVSIFTMAINLIVGILSAITAPKMGHLSDRFGRTKLLALSSLGGCASEAIVILCAKYPDIFHYNWIILAAVFDGLTGSFTAGQILSNSYSSDCTPPSKRAVSIGRLHACLFTGLAFGPLLASYLVALTGSLLSVFYVTLGCHMFFVLFVGFVVPESLSKERQLRAQKDHDEQEAAAAANGNVVTGSARYANVLAPLTALWPTKSGSSPALRQNLVAFATVDTILMGAAFSAGTVLLLYCESENTWGWGTLEASRFISAVSFVRVFVLLACLPTVNYLFRLRPAAKRARETGVHAVDRNQGADTLDLVLIRFAVASDVVGSLGYLLSRRAELFVFSGMLTAFGGLGSATIQAAITKHVPPEQVGKLLGAIGLLHALSRVAGPIAFNSLYYATVGKFDQAIFALLVALFGLAMLASLFIRPHGECSSSCASDIAADSIQVYLREHQPEERTGEEAPLIRQELE